jgi:catechol 2,3-dioxygenase-like lactoylglutathione lyase family enzyme
MNGQEKSKRRPQKTRARHPKTAFKSFCASVFFCFAFSNAEAQWVERPPITGIANVLFSCSDYEKSSAFYRGSLGLLEIMHPPGEKQHGTFWVTEITHIELDCTKKPLNSVLEIVFLTPDVQKMREYLVAKGLHPTLFGKRSWSKQEFRLETPEGHRIAFVQGTGQPLNLTGNDPRISKNLIHAGFVVKDRAAMDKFYKDILGFHLYWSGGMKNGETDWVDMQVPDGTDWIEYMLNVGPNADKHTLGVMNHIALGVPDVRAAANQLDKNGVQLPEQPKIGRDGKWQLNLYDPDGTRVELMEFTPAEKPCCSEYTGPHPKP